MQIGRNNYANGKSWDRVCLEEYFSASDHLHFELIGVIAHSGEFQDETSHYYSYVKDPERVGPNGEQWAKCDCFSKNHIHFTHFYEMKDNFELSQQIVQLHFRKTELTEVPGTPIKFPSFKPKEPSPQAFDYSQGTAGSPPNGSPKSGIDVSPGILGASSGAQLPTGSIPRPTPKSQLQQQNPRFDYSPGILGASSGAQLPTGYLPLPVWRLGDTSKRNTIGAFEAPAKKQQSEHSDETETLIPSESSNDLSTHTSTDPTDPVLELLHSRNNGETMKPLLTYYEDSKSDDPESTLSAMYEKFWNNNGELFLNQLSTATSEFAIIRNFHFKRFQRSTCHECQTYQENKVDSILLTLSTEGHTVQEKIDRFCVEELECTTCGSSLEVTATGTGDR